MEKEELERKIEELERLISDPNLAKGTAATITRVSGYHRPVENMNAGKQMEVAERLTYKSVD